MTLELALFGLGVFVLILAITLLFLAWTRR